MYLHLFGIGTDKEAISAQSLPCLFFFRRGCADHRDMQSKGLTELDSNVAKASKADNSKLLAWSLEHVVLLHWSEHRDPSTQKRRC